jgi:hypothetical protein
MKYLKQLFAQNEDVVVLDRTTFGALDVLFDNTSPRLGLFMQEVKKELKKASRIEIQDLRGGFRVEFHGVVSLNALRNTLTRTLRAEGFTVKHR